MIKVSVILPNYNHDKYLSLRIETILSQSFTDFELIILDDCSTDNSREIIEKYRDHPKVSQVVYNETNGGTTFLQWEKGIQLAKGEYIWIAESDDYSDTMFLETLVGKLESDKSLGLVFCACNIVDENNTLISKHYDYIGQYIELFSRSFVSNGKEFCEKHLFFACAIVNASSVVFKKELYNMVSHDFKNYKVSGDWRMWVDICYATNVCYIHESLNYFRFHSNNVRTRKAVIMNREGMLNLMASLNITDSEEVKTKLKIGIFKHWCFEFSRGVKDFKFWTPLNYMFQIIKIDHSFFRRLAHHIFSKLYYTQRKTN